MIKNRKQMLVIIGVFILTLLLGTVTYAFFNYTRTGTANNIKTGKIYFNADQGNNTVTLSDLFPISVGENEEITASTPGVGSLKLHITGDTTYGEGIEYLVEAVDVEGNGQTTLPISINISYAATSVEQGEDPNVIGTNDEDYFTNRGGDTSRYKLLSEGSISEGEDILVGYIAPGNTGIDGELTILAYLDAKNIAITDTYDEDEPETNLNGTTTNWVDGRTVFTTEEWNALQATGVSFKVKVTANEGTWFYTDESCFTTTVNNNEVTITGYDINCGSNVVIPKQIDGITVTKIGNSAFSLIGVGIERGQESPLFGLKSVVIPETITSIDSYAFLGNSIEKIILGENITSLSRYSFGINQLKYIEINSNVNIASMFISPFSWNSPEKTLKINSPLISLQSFKNSNITNLVLGDKVKTIESTAFIGNPFTSVTIPISVESWKCDAFDNTVEITNLSNVACSN